MTAHRAAANPTSLPRHIPANAIGIRRLAFTAFLALLLLLMAGLTMRRRAIAAQPAPPDALLLTASAGFERSATANGPDDAIVLRVRLENRGSATVDAPALHIALPPGVRAELDPRSSTNAPPLIGRTAVDWPAISVNRGDSQELPSIRLAPMPGVDGALIFRTASVRPVLSGAVPSGGTLPALPLGGLWGDSGLRRAVTPSGLTVLTREQPERALAALQIAVGTGTRDDQEPFGCAAAATLATALVEARQARPPAATSAPAPPTAFIARVEPEYSLYNADLPVAEVSGALASFAGRITDADGLIAGLARTRGAVVKQQTQRAQTPKLRADDEFLTLVVGTPLGQEPPAVEDCPPNIATQRAMALAQAAYRPANMALSISGPLTHDQALATVSRALGTLPSGERPNRSIRPAQPQSDRRILRLGAGDGAQQISLGWPAPAGGQDGMVTALIAAWLTRAGGVQARYLPFSDGGALQLTAEAGSLAESDDFVTLLLGLLQQLRDGPIDQGALDAAMRDATQLGEGGVSDGRGDAVAALAGALRSPNEWSAGLRSLRAADLQRVALQWFGTNTYTLVRVGSLGNSGRGVDSP